MLRDILYFYRHNPVRPEVIELRNMAIASRLLIECAKRRTESRGLHYNVDYPEKEDKYFRKDTIIRRGEI
jgi:L-aspartate oxidase